MFPALLVVAAVALPQPTQYYAFCWTPPTKQLVYVSAPFQSSEGSTAKLEAAFKAFVKQQYGYSANDGQCSTDLTAAMRDGKRAALLKQAQGLDGEVTAVTFSYTPPAVSAAATPAPAAPSPVDTTLNPGNLKEPWLQKARDELKGSAGWCSTNIVLHRIFDCACFARLVFQFRVAHAADYKQSYRDEGTGWVGFSNIVMAPDFVCTHCLEDARLTKYVQDMMLENNYPAISAGRTTADKVKARATSCVAPKYIAEFRAHPHVFEEQGNYNRAVIACSP
ncbi:MAG TPA: hypothetical protein VL241_05695 [Gemmatimonadales bacterium]|nr:hypothetical protein [Gemmatimonadales bacterium]